MRRILVSFVGVSLVAGTAGMSWGDAPVASGGEAAVQLVANGRIVRPRTSSGTPTVRRYRSYSIDPGSTGVMSDTSAGAVMAAPRAVSPAPAPSRGSKPSYMRADSKARGRYHQ